MKMESLETNPELAIGSDIQLSDVSYAVDGKAILNGISISICAARVGIVGRNGSGKSTLARIIAGLIAPSTGTVRINDHDLAKDRKAALKEVGILFQNPDHQIIFPTVQEEISFGLRQLGNSKEAAADKTTATLARFGKAHWEEAYINTLSQGQKQLLCLMAVAAMEPNTILLDEPLAGLDIPTKMQLRQYFAGYSGSLIHISHDPEDIRDYDLSIWIENGAVLQIGRPDDVLPAYVEQMRKLGGSDDIADLSG